MEEPVKGEASPPTLGRGIFVLRCVQIRSGLLMLLQTQRAAPAFAALLPQMPLLLDRLKEVWPDFPDESRVALLREVAALGSSGISVKRGSPFEAFCLETAITRLVDAFEAYLSRVLMISLRAYPEAMGDASISIRELRECASVEEAIDRKIERKVRDLTFSGIVGVC